MTATTETGTGRPGYGPEKAADGNVTSYWMGDFDVGAVAEPVINSEAKLYKCGFRWEFGLLKFEEGLRFKIL